jgi:hypothetical protein
VTAARRTSRRRRTPPDRQTERRQPGRRTRRHTGRQYRLTCHRAADGAPTFANVGNTPPEQLTNVRPRRRPPLAPEDALKPSPSERASTLVDLIVTLGRGS